MKFTLYEDYLLAFLETLFMDRHIAWIHVLETYHHHHANHLLYLVLTRTLLSLSSTRVFGVSTESMQLSFDSRGNCVPTILLMMQRRLYSQRGLEVT